MLTRRALARPAVLLVVALSWTTSARGTELRLAAHSRYFTEQQWFGEGTLAPWWSVWVQAHRAIERRPGLASRLTVRHGQPLQERDWPVLGLSRASVGMRSPGGREAPVRLYTLQIASYQRRRGVSAFLRFHWRPVGMPRRRVYSTVPKRLRLHLDGDFKHKNDPLYSVRARVKNHLVTRLRYGVYASVADANRDRAAVERRLHLRLQVWPIQLTERLPLLVWATPVAGRYLNEWDAG
jgi:hypothetical protein